MKSKVVLGLFCAIVLAAPVPGTAEWLLEGNAGVGMPQGDFGDFWGSGLLIGASVGYLSSPFEIGADINFLSNDPSGDYADGLESIGADDQFSFVQYGVHTRWMSPSQSSLSPYFGVGLAAYNLSEDYEEPGFSEELSTTALGVNVKAGANYWLNPALGLGLDVAYHAVWPEEEDIGHDSASFIGIQAGLRYKLGAH
jgi:opacity protein-like surface antigen